MEPIGRAKINDELLLDANELKRLLDFIIEHRHSDPNIRISYGCSHFLPLKYEHEVREWYFFCTAGIGVASVMANGDIASCLDIERRPELVQGNVRTDDFVDVWENRFQFFRDENRAASPKCLACYHWKYCLGGSLHTWNFDTREQEFCMKDKLSNFE